MADKDNNHTQTQPDDQLWLDVLAGKKLEGEDTAVEKQAEVLRRVIAAEQTSGNEALDEVSARRMHQALLKRLRQEKLIDSEPTLARKRRPIYAAGMVIVLLALGGYWWMQGYPLPEPGMSDDFPQHLVSRAGLDVQPIPVKLPDRTVVRLLSEVKALNLPWRLSRIGDDWLLEVFIGAKPSKEITDWVKKNGYRVDESGGVYLLITGSDK